ncbi:hypothetical protein Vretimale_19364 [Volvox reticuliferus]|uniref:F-box domain-containing protein n=1 Tax=Volvox reticuliferus TaxID=1737510 RepID=A0A8J4GZ57_9CHLO|nr:hypothetical protein Vretifemale_20600 [Volvox reticuliferus]GIM16775.1 hypothetical protein Vretimale_19364 [Volvox reticuliferus]
MPKLRLREASSGITYKLDLPQDCTWGALLAETRRVAGLPSDADVVLSLNKKAPLDGKLGDPLSSLGLRGGDLVWLLSPELLCCGELSATANCSTAKAEARTPTVTGGLMACGITPVCTGLPTAPAAPAAMPVSPVATSPIPVAQPQGTSATTVMEAQAQMLAKKSGGEAELGQRHGLTRSTPSSAAREMSDDDCGGSGEMRMEAMTQLDACMEDQDHVEGDGDVNGEEDATAMQALPAIRGVSLKLLKLLLPGAASGLAMDVEAGASTSTSLGTTGGGVSSTASCAWVTLSPVTRCLLILDCALEEAGFVGLQDLPALVRQGDLIPRQLLYGCSYTLAVTGNAGDGDDMKTEAAVGSVKRVVVGGGREPIGSGVAAMKLLWYVMARYLVVHGAPCITSGAAAVGGISPVTWHFDLAEYGGSSSRVASVGSGGAPSLRQSPNCLELPPDPAAHWRRLKDGLVLPLLAATCRAVGLTPPLGLMVLPMELQLAILRRLEARDLAALSCVCTALHHLASEDEIWRPLFDKEFHTNVLSAADTALANSRGYKYVFGRKWLERAERRKRRQVFRPAVPMWGPPPLAPFVRPPFMPPGSIGGDYDRLPAPRLGFGPQPFPTPFGGGGGIFQPGGILMADLGH